MVSPELDIIEASALAYLNAVNAIQTHKERGHVREVVGRPARGRERMFRVAGLEV